MMERQVAQMVRLVDDLLDVSPHQPRASSNCRKERVELAGGRAAARSRPAAR